MRKRSHAKPHEEIAVTVLVRREPGVLQYEIMLGAEGTGE